MTEVDEGLLSLAQLREVVHGDLDAAHPMHEHVGLLEDDADRKVVSFVESIHRDSFAQSELGSIVSATHATDAATKAVIDDRPALASHLVGMVETEYDGSGLTTLLDIIDALENNGAPAFVSVAGNPNTGKTNTVVKLVDVLDRAGGLVAGVPGDIMVISNMETWDRCDEVVKSMHDLMVALLEHRTKPKVVVVDEGSTHFDARTYNYAVAEQWTPAAKRFAKLNVYMTAIVTHTGKDLHPEAKRLTTCAVWKLQKDEAQFFENWPGHADKPTTPMFTDPVTDFEKADGYHPDDAAPWSWNLRAELFARDADWHQLLSLLKEHGPE